MKLTEDQQSLVERIVKFGIPKPTVLHAFKTNDTRQIGRWKHEMILASGVSESAYKWAKVLAKHRIAKFYDVINAYRKKDEKQVSEWIATYRQVAAKTNHPTADQT